MAITLSGDGIARANLAADVIDGTKLADDAVNSEHLAAGGVDDAHLATGITSSKLTGALPAVSGVNLTALNATNLGSGTVPDARFPATLPAASAANLTAIPAANITGTLPAISGANLTGITTGKVLQVVQNTTSTTTHITSSTTLTVVADLNVAITPSATSSKILVLMTCGGMIEGVTNAIQIDMLRGVTTVVSRPRQGYYSGGATAWVPVPFSMNYLDSPSTTSAVTYSFKVALGASSTNACQINPSTGTNEGIVIAMEIGA